MPQLIIYNIPSQGLPPTFWRGKNNSYASEWSNDIIEAHRFSSLKEVSDLTEGEWSTHYAGSYTAWGVIPEDQVHYLTDRTNAVVAADQAVEARDQWFAEKVMDYSEGCDSGKVEFLQEIGLDKHVSRDLEFSFRVTVTVAGGSDGYEEAGQVSHYIDTHELAYCSDYEAEERY